MKHRGAWGVFWLNGFSGGEVIEWGFSAVRSMVMLCFSSKCKKVGLGRSLVLTNILEIDG